MDEDLDDLVLGGSFDVAAWLSRELARSRLLLVHEREPRRFEILRPNALRLLPEELTMKPRDLLARLPELRLEF